MERTLPQWLAWLEAQHPQHQIELGLGRIGRVAQQLALTKLPGKVVTVAGTNGKGTTCALAEAILIEQGYRVGVYSSPHLLHFNERSRVQGQPFRDQEHCEAFTVVEAARGEVELTFFEFVTLAALWLFARAQLDVLLLEVGLGGRLDATNIVDSDVAVITTIALDHCDWLGNSRELIGYEKASIARAQRPLISGEPNPPASIAATAKRIGAKLYQWGREFNAVEGDEHWEFHGVTRQWLNLPKPTLPLMNAVTALAALEQLDLPLELAAIQRGLAKATLAGRMQTISKEPEIIVDVAHNPHSAHYLADKLRTLPAKDGRLLLLVGMLKDKDMVGTLTELKPLNPIWHLATLEGGRGATATQLYEALGQEAVCYDSVIEGYQKLLAQLAPNDRLVVFGSFHTVAAVLATLEEK